MQKTVLTLGLKPLTRIFFEKITNMERNDNIVHCNSLNQIISKAETHFPYLIVVSEDIFNENIRSTLKEHPATKDINILTISNLDDGDDSLFTFPDDPTAAAVVTWPFQKG